MLILLIATEQALARNFYYQMMRYYISIPLFLLFFFLLLSHCVTAPLSTRSAQVFRYLYILNINNMHYTKQQQGCIDRCNPVVLILGFMLIT